jgi:hypothetical protein
MRQYPRLEALAASRGWVFPLLTLDVVRTFYDMMGLSPANASYDLQMVLRDATITVRKRVWQIAAGALPPTLAEFWRSVEAAMEPAATERLAWWLQNVLHAEPRDNLGLSHWNHVLRYCRHCPDCWERLGFPTEVSSEALNRFRKAIDITEYRRRYDELQACPLSDWDLHMYASQLYDFDNDLEGPSASPFVTVLATIRDYQAYQFWAWVLRTLRPDQLTHLWEGGKRIVREEELTSVTELPHPTTLGIGL